MLIVMVSPAETLSPKKEFGGSNEPSMVFSTSISLVGFSEDLLTETLNMFVCRVGVSCSEILEGKCFSSIPTPLSFIRVSFTSLITSHLQEK